MRNNINHGYKSIWTSLAGIGTGLILVGAAYFLASEKASVDTPVEVTIPTETLPVETAPNEQKSAIDNPFTKTMSFKRTTTASGNSAILEIKVETDGNYVLKECITGEIISKGIWAYDEDSAHLTLTEVGAYPYINVFKLEEYQESEDITTAQIKFDNTEYNVETLSNLANPTNFKPKYQLAFVTESSTNIKYELLNKYDVFIEQEQRTTPETTQLRDIGKKGDA